MKTYLTAILILCTAWACQDYYEDGGTLSGEPLPVNTLEFIKSRPDLFDSTLMVIERSGLAEFIASGDITFFVPQKRSVNTALSAINNFVRSKRDSLGYTKDTVLLDDVPAEKWAEYLSRYIFKGTYLRDDIAKGKLVYDDGKNYITGGQTVNSHQGYPMTMLCDWTTWDNVPEAGPHYIYLVDAKGTDITNPDEAKYLQVQVITSNIRTSSGTVHVLSRQHEFGFSNSGKFIPAKPIIEEEK